jgi:hypothetical protein
LSIGLLDKSLIHPREIFSSALENKAANIILIHNHPSGDPTPSRQDKQVAKNIGKAGQIMGIALLDFVIIAKNGHNSFYQELKHNKTIGYVGDGNPMLKVSFLISALRLSRCRQIKCSFFLSLILTFSRFKFRRKMRFCLRI